MKEEEEKEEDTWFATSDTSHNDKGPDWTQYRLDLKPFLAMNEIFILHV